MCDVLLRLVEPTELRPHGAAFALRRGNGLDITKRDERQALRRCVDLRP